MRKGGQEVAPYAPQIVVESSQRSPAIPALVSVIVPVYNVRPYVGDALRSLDRQTLDDLEVLVIDDGSSDGSEELARDFCQTHPRFQYFRQENSGYGRAVNQGLERATGAYVGILESDDRCDPEMFAVLYQAATQNDADLVRGSYYRYWDGQDGASEVLEADQTHRRLLGGRTEGWVTLSDHLGYFFTAASIWSGLYRRSFLEKEKLRVLETPGASYQDKPFFLETMLCAKRFYCLDRPLVYYRQTNPGSSSSKGTDKGLLLFSLYREMHRRFALRDEVAYRGWGRKLLYSGLVHDHYWNLSNLKQPLKRSFLTQLRDELRSLGLDELPELLGYCDHDRATHAMTLARHGIGAYRTQDLWRRLAKAVKRFVKPLFVVFRLHTSQAEGNQ